MWECVKFQCSVLSHFSSSNGRSRNTFTSLLPFAHFSSCIAKKHLVSLTVTGRREITGWVEMAWERWGCAWEMLATEMEWAVDSREDEGKGLVLIRASLSEGFLNNKHISDRNQAKCVLVTHPTHTLRTHVLEFSLLLILWRHLAEMSGLLDIEGGSILITGKGLPWSNKIAAVWLLSGIQRGVPEMAKRVLEMCMKSTALPEEGGGWCEVDELAAGSHTGDC